MLLSRIHGGRPSSFVSSSVQIDIKNGLELFFADIDKICLGKSMTSSKDISFFKKQFIIFKNHFGNLNFIAEHYYKSLKEKYEFSSKTYDFNRLIILFSKFSEVHRSIDVSFYKRLKELYQQDKANPLKSRYIDKFHSQGEDSQNDFFKQFLKGEKHTEFSSLLTSQSSVATSKTTRTDSSYLSSSSPFSLSVIDQTHGKEIDKISRQLTQIFKQIDESKQFQTAISNDDLYNKLKINLQFLLDILIEQNKPESIRNWKIRQLLIKKLEKELPENLDTTKNDYLSALKEQCIIKKHEDLIKKSSTASPISAGNLSLLTRLASCPRGSKSSRDFDKMILMCEKINKYLIEQPNHQASEGDSERTIQGARKEIKGGNIIREISYSPLSRSSDSLSALSGI